MDRKRLYNRPNITTPLPAFEEAKQRESSFLTTNAVHKAFIVLGKYCARWL